MTLDTSQLGKAGELALTLYALITSEGQVELYAPVVDDDHVDLVGAMRGGLPVIGLQVKTENHVDKGGQVEARASSSVEGDEAGRRKPEDLLALKVPVVDIAVLEDLRWS
jgi:hypothetical protein